MPGDPIDLGVCCACMEAPATGIAMLPFALPDELVRESSAGTWGCFVCGLPSKGAIAVLCDRCGAEYEKHDTGLGPIRMVVVGTPADNNRVPVGVLNGPQEHDLSLHTAYEDANEDAMAMTQEWLR